MIIIIIIIIIIITLAHKDMIFDYCNSPFWRHFLKGILLLLQNASVMSFQILHPSLEKEWLCCFSLEKYASSSRSSTIWVHRKKRWEERVGVNQSVHGIDLYSSLLPLISISLFPSSYSKSSQKFDEFWCKILRCFLWLLFVLDKN